MHVCIVGGGISGLYSGLLLQKLGHEVTIYEASNRLGGRIYTHHFGSPSSHAYFEAGAMRIPRSPLHKDVFNLIKYINNHSSTTTPIELIPYILETKNNFSYALGQKSSTCPAGTDTTLPARFGLPKEFHGKSAKDLLEDVISPWILKLEMDFDAGFEELVKYDELSFRQYLRIVAGWPHEVVDFLETVLSQSNQYELAFTEIVMQNLDFNTKEWATIKGGMSNLISAASNLIGPQNIHLNTAVTSISPTTTGTTSLTITTSNPSIPPQTFPKTILAIPPSSLHNLLSRPQFCPQKEQAIRSLHYEPLFKMGLHFASRFWEKGNTPCFGGQSMTDLRFRWIVYPSNDIGSGESGVLLLYCWMNDALRWTALSKDERIKLALHDLSLFFKDYEIETEDQDGTGDKKLVQVDIHSQFIESFDISWSTNSATGDAMFLPGQFSRFRHVIGTSECNNTLYFAGEHLSRHHTWIAGACDSCLNTVRDIVGDKEAVFVEALGSEREGYAVEMATGIVRGKGRGVDAGVGRLRGKRSWVEMGVF